MVLDVVGVPKLFVHSPEYGEGLNTKEFISQKPDTLRDQAIEINPADAGYTEILNQGGIGHILGAQIFKSSETCSEENYIIKSVKLRLRTAMLGGSGNVVVSIRNISAELPTGSDLTTASIPVSKLTTNFKIFEFKFTKELIIKKNTYYALCIDAAGLDFNHMLNWGTSQQDYIEGWDIATSNDGGTNWIKEWDNRSYYMVISGITE